MIVRYFPIKASIHSGFPSWLCLIKAIYSLVCCHLFLRWAYWFVAWSSRASYSPAPKRPGRAQVAWLVAAVWDPWPLSGSASKGRKRNLCRPRYFNRIGLRENLQENRKTLYLVVKTMVSCRFSFKPIHWYLGQQLKSDIETIARMVICLMCCWGVEPKWTCPDIAKRC